ncbi:gamma-tubulin complex component 2-like isoform X2 [Chrysoperla carnea]|uniref:gamma-tubulin complex component 2-like isoform X2 n=1 Tax=Chrysoperla carnea TaxID=189513 RepID=UPI001D096CFE|nr:gamma-tubulin complex component 2-like isoform X2 [Chrysoperla carnea]
MSEFEDHQLIKELLQTFGSNASLEECVNLISSGAGHGGNSNLRPIDKHVQEIYKNSPNPQLFLHKYNELQGKKVDSLGSFVDLLYMINKDTNLKKLMKKSAKVTPTSSNESITSKVVTRAYIPELKTKLYNAVANEKNATSKLKTFDHLHNDMNLEGMTNWISDRPHMSWDFLEQTEESGAPLMTVSVPAVSQESIIIDDLMYILTGVEGHIIEPLPIQEPYAPREFTFNQELDPSLQNLIKLTFPLASNYSIVQRFIEEKVKFEAGQVNHALVAAMTGFVKDYVYFVCQLEVEHRTESLTLQKMWFYIQRNMITMNVMAEIATTIGKANAKGGKALTLLHELSNGYLADAQAYKLCSFLLERASQPYMKMLGTWIYTGIINDPFKEFLVEDNQLVSKSEEPTAYADDFWEKRYSIRRERTPVFLEKVADVILRTGKYLNVVRQCGKTFKTETHELVYDPRDQNYIKVINKAYYAASHLLQNLLMQENDLIGRLRSVKRYFLLEQGDFIVQFMDLCEKELSKDINKVIVPRLEALFELALRLSVANNDLYKDDMRIELLPYDLQFQMFKILSIHTQDEQEYRCSEKPPLTGLESFSFGYEVKWPISLVLHRRAVACYQMIFRHLFFCKHVERQICKVWICNKDAKSFGHNEAKQYRGAFTLRQRMLNCVQNLEYHMMVEVIEPNWQAFQTKVTKMVDIDEVLNCHNDFLDMCLKDCMLTNPILLRTVTKLLHICMEFCSFIQRMQRYYVDAELSSMISTTHEATEHFWQSPEHSLSNSMSASMSASMFGPDQTQPHAPVVEALISESESFEQSIKRFDVQFSTILLSLMNKINDLGRQNTNDKLVNLLYRFGLDFNNLQSFLESKTL